jgi:putative DNA-binding protein
MHTLPEIQRAFAAAIRSGDCREAAPLIAAGAVAPEDAIGIYRNTFIAGATRALKLSYPAVERLTGTEFFDHVAAEFIAVSPPSSGCLDDYGAGFAEFLARCESVAGLSYLPDVARLEWAVDFALHAADAAVVTAENFSAAGTIAPERLVLVPHPSLSLLQTEFPADAIWRAALARDHDALSSLTLSGGPFFLLVERTGEGVDVTRIPQAAWMFLSALCAGRSFADAFAAAPSTDLPPLLAKCVALGRFSAFEEKDS